MKLFRSVLKHWTYLADFVVIVAGVLIAFTLNNWWNNRQNNSIEQELLISLRNEIKIDLNEVELVINRIDSTIKSAEQLLSYAGPDATELPPDKFWKLLKPCLGKLTYDGSHAIISAIVNNNEVRLIKNPDIQNQLALLPTKLRDYIEDEEFTENALDLHLRPYIYRKFPAYSMDKRPGHFKVSTKRTLQDPEFDSYIGRIHYRQNRMLKEILDYKDQLILLVGLLEEELGIEPIK